MPFVPVASVFLVPIGLLIMIKLGGNNDVTKGQLSPFNELLGLSYVGIIFMQTLGTNIGDATRIPEGVDVPRGLLEQFPEKVQDSNVLQVPGPRINRNVCDRIANGRNCDRLSNCPNLHPDCIAERWVVPDLLCHKWFQGICGFGDRCWNQHGDTFDNAVALAIQTQQGLRRDMAPFLYDPADGGTIRQINREAARRMFRTTIKHDSEVALRYELDHLLRVPEFCPLRPRSKCGKPTELDVVHFEIDLRQAAIVVFFPLCQIRDTSDKNGSTVDTTFLRWPQYGNGDVGDRGRETPTSAPIVRGQSPTQRWLDSPHTTPMMVEVDDNNPESTTTTTHHRVPDDDDLWNAVETEVQESRRARQEPFDPWAEVDEVINQNIPESARRVPPQTTTVQVKAMPKQPPITLNLDPVGNPSGDGFTGVAMAQPMTASVTSSIPATISSRPPTTTSPMTPVLNEPFNIDGFRLAWPAEQFRNKGPTALDEIRREPPVNEMPQFGFITGRRFTGFPVLSMALAPMVRLGANNVSMLPPGNHPYAAFAGMPLGRFPTTACSTSTRTYFAGHPDTAPHFAAEPPSYGLRRCASPSDTEPVGTSLYVNHFRLGAVLPAARALEELTGGVDPSSIEGRLAKQRRRMYDEETAQVAVEVLAFRRAQEQMGLARLRQQFSRAENEQLFEIWRRRLAGEAVDAEGNPVQSHEAEVIEKGHEDGNKRLREYLAFLSAKHDDPRHEKSFDCTFCGKLFPAHFLLCLNPAELDDCGAMYTIGARGTVIGQRYNNFDRADVADFDDDYDHTHRDSGMPVFRRKGQVVTTIPVHEWYSLCSKVITYRRRQLSDQVRDQNSSWKAMCDEIRRERPDESSAGTRREVRARILTLTARFVADMDQLDTDRRARVMIAFEQWQVSYGYAFWDMALNDTPLTNCLFKVTDSLGQHFICRNVDCTSVIHNHHWLRQISTDYPIREQHGRYTCPKMLVNIDVEVHGGQRISKNSTDYHLFLMEWEKADDDMLFGRLKQIMAEYRADLGTDNFRAPLQAAIRDQAVKYQLLGYFEEIAWTLENMQKFLNRNYSIKRQNRYRPDLLPTANHPYKYQDETFNTTEHFEAYGVGSTRKGPPYYHFGVYQYDPDATVIMKQNDFMRFMSLCYIQLRAIQYIQGDYSFSNVILSSSDNADGSARPPCKVADNDWIVFDSSELPLSPTAGHSASDFPAMALVVGWTGFLGESPAIYRSNRGAMQRRVFCSRLVNRVYRDVNITGIGVSVRRDGSFVMPLLHAHCPGSQFLELSNKPNLHDIDLAALRNLEAIVNGLTYQINALRLRIDAIRTGVRTERRRRITEFAHIFESYVPIEVFMAAARNESNDYSDVLLLFNNFVMKAVMWLEQFFSLASRDILSVDALRNIPETTLVEISRPVSTWISSLSKALMAARPEFRDESLNELRKNTYAATTMKSRRSTQSRRVFGPADISRGPSKLKDSFYVEDIAKISHMDFEFPGQMPALGTTIVPPNRHGNHMLLAAAPGNRGGVRDVEPGMDRDYAFRPYGLHHLPRTKMDIVGDDCQPMNQTVEIFRSVIEATGTTMTCNGPDGTMLQRSCEHVCRVSRAQMLTRRGFPLDTVQLLQVYKRLLYIAAINIIEHRIKGNPSRSERWSSTTSRRYDRSFGWSTRNTMTKMVHLAEISETSTDSTHWRTICGWPYGFAPHRRE
ncbi:unnamed protein product [Symbiodinium necroappetens]|uniref:C3H1-type domain-containing protein n=1 Tax=Symbiodinium necroappetens TaxID=1628268 RepID=A0A812PEA6_9DINO|nr:unnamed protein product [Symbiodinium necroappetens]